MSYTNGLDKPSDYFNTVLYTGNGTAIGSGGNAITGVGFQPDFVWIKARSQAYNHHVYDVIRGVQQRLITNGTFAELTLSESLESFDTDGFTVGDQGAHNESGTTYASWNWLAGGTASSNTDGSITSSVSANTTSGFSIVTWTGVGSATNADTVGHGLNQKPDIYIFRNRSQSTFWIVRTDVIDGSSDFLNLDTTNAKSDSGVNYADSSVFSLGSSVADNTSGDNYVGYFFHSVKGYSKIGKYTGNGSTDGTFVYTGFKPAFLILKRTDTTEDWFIFDNKRSTANGGNVLGYRLKPNTTDTENQFSAIDFTSNGFKNRVNNTGTNSSGGTYIYMAFASNPFVTSTGIPATAR